MSAIFNVVSSSIFTGLAIIGAGTFINKVGIFIKTYEEEPKDSYKKAFDKTMIQSVEEINFCIDSMKKIATTTTKSTGLVSEIMLGSKVIQKDKNGKIIISDKSKLHNQYEDTISELNMKVKKYQEELKKVKQNKQKEKENKYNGTYSDKEEDEDDEEESDDEEFILEQKKSSD